MSPHPSATKTQAVLHPSMFPKRFANVEELEDFMSTPSQALIDDMTRLDGDIIVLGVGGKMGVTLARLAKRAAPEKRVVGVSRFSNPEERQKLESWGIETITCDLMERKEVEALPKLPNVIYMAGKKFGTEGSEGFTWAMNTYVPALVAEAFSKSRIAAFSSCLVYPWVEPGHGGSREEDPPMAQPGEYANSVIGRERIFQYFSQKYHTPGRLVRLAYAVDMRYGVLNEIANWVWSGKPVPLATGHVNVIWQGDASSQTLRSLLHCTVPTSPINQCGPEPGSVRALALEFGRIFGKQPVFEGAESKCVFVNSGQAARLFGYPMVPLKNLIEWTADWVSLSKPTFGKPSHFETRNGVF
jgi:nucleoside-diphosphate-sugar epimerase